MYSATCSRQQQLRESQRATTARATRRTRSKSESAEPAKSANPSAPRGKSRIHAVQAAGRIPTLSQGKALRDSKATYQTSELAERECTAQVGRARPLRTWLQTRQSRQ